MDISSDYRELLKLLGKHRVKYLIIGAYAAVYYTEPRFTKDLDLWAKADIENAGRLYEALEEFGAPLKGIRSEDFTNEKMVYQIGVAPIRVDIFFGIPGMNFDSAWKNRIRATYGDAGINIVGIKELVKSKKISGRPQDNLDIDKLLPKIRKSKKKTDGKYRKK